MRLIDADELKRKLKETAPGLKWIFNEIDNAPTIMRSATSEERENDIIQNLDNISSIKNCEDKE